MTFQRLGQQEFSKDVLAVFRQLELLRFRTVILEREYHWIVAGDEGRVSDGVDHFLEIDVRAHRFAMGNHRFSFVLSIPAVQLDAATASQENLSIHFHGRSSTELSALQVRVVRGIDQIVAHGLVHVVVDFQTIEKDRCILVGHQVTREPVARQIAGVAVRGIQLVELDDALGTFRVEEWKENFVQARIALSFIQPVDQLLRGDASLAACQLIEQRGDIRTRTDLVIEIAEFLEREISRIDLIVLKPLFEKNDMHTPVVSSFLPFRWAGRVLSKFQIYAFPFCRRRTSC